MTKDEIHSGISRHARIRSNVQLEHPVVLRDHVEVWPESRIGSFTFINASSVIYGKVAIGRFCSIGRTAEIGATSHPLSFLSTHEFQYTNENFPSCPGYARLQNAEWDMFPPTFIGNDVWVGSKAVIRAGVSVGDGAVIGAGAVVTSNIPAYAIAVGVPARIVRHRFPQATIERLLELQWWDMPLDQLSRLPFDNVDACIESLAHLRIAAPAYERTV